MNNNLSTEQTIVPAWDMVVQSNNITENLVFHSDRGSQYASQIFTNIIKSYKGTVTQCMSRKGDNSVAESFFKSLKVEWVYKQNTTKGLKLNYQYFNG